MKKFSVFLLVVIVFILIKPLLHNGFPETHDGANHLARIANYALALKQGQFPPRIAPSFLGGYGYPVFNYNYPLANILSIPFLFLRFSVEGTMKILLISFVIFGAVGMYGLMKSFVSKKGAMFSTCVYLLTPFLFTMLYVRGAIGEIIAYTVFPHVLVSITSVFRKPTRKSAIYVFFATLFFLLSHNLVVALLSLVIVLYVFMCAWKYREKGNVFISFIPLLLAFSSSFFFWIPAFFEQHFVNISQVNLVKDFLLHFATLSQLLLSQFEYGFSYPGPVDTLSFQIGMIPILILLYAPACIFLKKKFWKKIMAFSLISYGLIFLMIESSAFLWNKIPFLFIMQFPWRLLGLLLISTSVLAGLIYDSSTNKLKKFLFLLVLISVIQTARHPMLNYLYHEDLYYYTFSGTSTVQNENKPRTFLAEVVELSAKRPEVFSGTVLQVDVWSGSLHTYLVEMQSEGQVVEPTAFFPGWKVYIDGIEVAIDSIREKGLISFVVPAGIHDIQTRFTQDTIARNIGNISTGISLVMFVLFYMFFPRIAKNNEKK